MSLHASASHPRLGFNGELHEAMTNWQLLGSGYRAHSPVLMRFNLPDSESPFRGGGVNGYAYGRLDPANSVDPSGHVAWSVVANNLFRSFGRAITAMGSAIARPFRSMAGAFSSRGVPRSAAGHRHSRRSVASSTNSTASFGSQDSLRSRRTRSGSDARPQPILGNMQVDAGAQGADVIPPGGRVIGMWDPGQHRRAGSIDSGMGVRRESAGSVDSILTRPRSRTMHDIMRHDLLSKNLYSMSSIKRLERLNRKVRRTGSVSSATSTSSSSSTSTSSYGSFWRWAGDGNE